MNFVVEQTGYPEDMVDLDADLEGDLGIDSIKKAQLLGELNEKFRFSTADDMSGATSFDDFATLRSIRDFIVKRLEDAPAPSLQEEASSFSSEDSIENNRKEIADYLTRFVADQTGYPESMISLDLDLGTDLGIDSIKKAQLFAEIAEMFSAYPLASQSLEDFNTLGQIYEAVVKEL